MLTSALSVTHAGIKEYVSIMLAVTRVNVDLAGTGNIVKRVSIVLILFLYLNTCYGYYCSFTLKETTSVVVFPSSITTWIVRFPSTIPTTALSKI